MTEKTVAGPQGAKAGAMNAPEILEIDDHRVACDGGGGALGHPRVFLEMGDEAQIQCPYCGVLFVLRGHAVKPVTA